MLITVQVVHLEKQRVCNRVSVSCIKAECSPHRSPYILFQVAWGLPFLSHACHVLHMQTRTVTCLRSYCTGKNCDKTCTKKLLARQGQTSSVPWCVALYWATQHVLPTESQSQKRTCVADDTYEAGGPVQAASAVQSVAGSARGVAGNAGSQFLPSLQSSMSPLRAFCLWRWWA